MMRVFILLFLLASGEALAQQSLTSVKTQLDAMFAGLGLGIQESAYEKSRGDIHIINEYLNKHED